MKFKILLMVVVVMGSISCSNVNVNPKDYYDENFETEKYLGTWYEIVRKDHKFERGLINVTADYRLMENGNIKVVNSGYDTNDEEIQVAEGVAKPKYKGSKNLLKVSFFWPFYADYIIMEYDENYTYALVRSKSDGYLWILSRTPKMDQEIVDRLLEKAKNDGISLDDIIYVEQEGEGKTECYLQTREY